ncbi:hypothetical protein Scep_019041 [Stephania cephalantha]|uniref:TLC domain-containing protein n=1 Tax=Stephania cephalantha TaxID=152367 RepID=A0AAP0IAB1_9MAGN
MGFSAKTSKFPQNQQQNNREREREMARREGQSSRGNNNNSGAFFLATLLLWFVSVAFEIAFNARTELLCVVAGCCFYQMANWVVRYFVTKDPLFVNTAVSLIHSSIASFSEASEGTEWSVSTESSVVEAPECEPEILRGLSAPTCSLLRTMLILILRAVLFILVNQWKMTSLEHMFEHAQLFSGMWSGAYQALCFSCGYFAYDQLDMLLYRLYNGYIPAILFHSIFLHVRKLRRMVGVRDPKSKVVRAEWTLSWIFFFTARLGSHILITIKLIKDANKFGRGVELPLALFGMVGMNLLNVFLGRDLFIAYKRELHQQNHQD